MIWFSNDIKSKTRINIYYASLFYTQTVEQWKITLTKTFEICMNVCMLICIYVYNMDRFIIVIKALVCVAFINTSCITRTTKTTIT